VPTVSLPPGCCGFNSADGSTIRAKSGGKAELTDAQYSRLKQSDHVKIGMISADGAVSIGTKKGRVCPGCHFRAQAWTTLCPRCDTATVPE
jgi:hypothetical protein